jgi:DNA-binding GntR family transcriptional regulator
MKIERPRSLAEVVTARLRAEIVEGEFHFGQALSESKIATRYNVSRTPVREAFALLGLEGLVRAEPQHGTFVLTMDREQFGQISETRFILETAAFGLVLKRNRAALRTEWRRLVEAMRGALQDHDSRHYSRYDGEFHQTLFDLAVNPYLATAYQSLSPKLAAVRNRLGATPEHMERSCSEHAELLALVERGEDLQATKLLERHILDKGESFWSVEVMAPKTRWERISELAI